MFQRLAITLHLFGHLQEVPLHSAGFRDLAVCLAQLSDKTGGVFCGGFLALLVEFIRHETVSNRFIQFFLKVF